jgi:cytochrome P450
MRSGRAPGAWPLLGHVAALQRRPLRFMESLAAHGDLVEIRLGPRPAFVLCHPDLAHQVLTDFRAFDRAGPVYDRVRAAMGNGLATAAHGDHRRQRLIMQPVFRHEHLSGYVTVMRREVAAAMDGWRDGGRVEMVDEMFRLTTTIALRTLFSSRIGSQEAEELREAFDVFLRGTYLRAMLPAAGRLPTPGNRRYDTALAHWRGRVAALIEDYRRAGRGHGDLMSRLLAARDEQGTAMTDEELSDQVAVLLLAGGETTSAALVWSLHLLEGHPRILRALHAEVDTVLAGDVAGWEHLPRLELTARVVREALRLYPPAWVVPRTAVRETRLAGRTLPAGAMVLFSPYVLHRRADMYPQPHRFDPDRWLDPARHRAAFLPFGAGAAKCIGSEFGLAEATLVLASVAARWRLTPEPGSTVSPTARAVLVPRALPVRLSARHTG